MSVGDDENDAPENFFPEAMKALREATPSLGTFSSCPTTPAFPFVSF